MENNMRMETELPNKMASLDILENSHINNNLSKNTEDEASSQHTVRLLRKRATHSSSPTTNRRVTMKPKKKQFKMIMNEDEIRKYYLDQKVKTPSQTLETIFEEPKSANSGTTILIGNKKIKRSLTFHIGLGSNKDKIKKRRMRIKRLIGTKNFLNRKKLSMQTFIENLQLLDPEEPINPVVCNSTPSTTTSS